MSTERSLKYNSLEDSDSDNPFEDKGSSKRLSILSPILDPDDEFIHILKFIDNFQETPIKNSNTKTKENVLEKSSSSSIGKGQKRLSTRKYRPKTSPAYETFDDLLETPITKSKYNQTKENILEKSSSSSVGSGQEGLSTRKYRPKTSPTYQNIDDFQETPIKKSMYNIKTKENVLEKSSSSSVGNGQEGLSTRKYRPKTSPTYQTIDDFQETPIKKSKYNIKTKENILEKSSSSSVGKGQKRLSTRNYRPKTSPTYQNIDDFQETPIKKSKYNIKTEENVLEKSSSSSVGNGQEGLSTRKYRPKTSPTYQTIDDFQETPIKKSKYNIKTKENVFKKSSSSSDGKGQKRLSTSLTIQTKSSSTPSNKDGSLSFKNSIDAHDVSQLDLATTPKCQVDISLPSRSALDFTKCETYDVDDDLPPTRPVTPTLQTLFKDMVAFIEFKCADNKYYYMGLQEELEKLGAKVEKKFTKKVTHCFFCRGKLSTYRTAVERKVPLLSMLWIEECKKQLAVVPFDGFEISLLEDYEARHREYNIQKATPKAIRKLERELYGKRKTTPLKNPVRDDMRELEKYQKWKAKKEKKAQKEEERSRRLKNKGHK